MNPTVHGSVHGSVVLRLDHLLAVLEDVVVGQDDELAALEWLPGERAGVLGALLAENLAPYIVAAHVAVRGDGGFLDGHPGEGIHEAREHGAEILFVGAVAVRVLLGAVGPAAAADGVKLAAAFEKP